MSSLLPANGWPEPSDSYPEFSCYRPSGALPIVAVGNALNLQHSAVKVYQVSVLIVLIDLVASR